jgi:hypothetical protein
MKRVGVRVERELSLQPSGVLLAEGARFSQAMAQLSCNGHIPKGVYRFSSHQQSNMQTQNYLVEAMARLAMQRGHGHG